MNFYHLVSVNIFIEFLRSYQTEKGGDQGRLSKEFKDLLFLICQHLSFIKFMILKIPLVIISLVFVILQGRN